MHGGGQLRLYAAALAGPVCRVAAERRHELKTRLRSGELCEFVVEEHVFGRAVAGEQEQARFGVARELFLNHRAQRRDAGAHANQQRGRARLRLPSERAGWAFGLELCAELERVERVGAGVHRSHDLELSGMRGIASRCDRVGQIEIWTARTEDDQVLARSPAERRACHEAQPMHASGQRLAQAERDAEACQGHRAVIGYFRDPRTGFVLCLAEP